MTEFKKGDEVLVEASIEDFNDNGDPIVSIQDLLKGASHQIIAKKEMLRPLYFGTEDVGKNAIFSISLKESENAVEIFRSIVEDFKKMREELREKHKDIVFDDKVNACETITQKETDLYYFIHLSEDGNDQSDEAFDGDFMSLFDQCMESVIDLTNLIVNTESGKRPLLEIKTF